MIKLPAFFGGAVEDRPQPGNTFIAPDHVTTRTPREKIDFHIRRFTLAIEQCEKGEDRLAELQANRDYWISVRDLETSRGGLK